MWQTVLRVGIFGAAALLLAGCDTFGLGAAPPPAPAARALDLRTDDLTKLVLALDLPANLQPLAKGSIASFDVSTRTSGARHVKAMLVLADGDDIDGALPPPAPGRTYYLLGFSDRDRAAMADAQQWLVGLPPAAAPVTGFSVAPKLCETSVIDPSSARLAVVPALPGAGPLLPILGPEPLGALLNGGQLPPCGSV